MKLLTDFILVGGIIIILLILFVLIRSKNKKLHQKILIFIYCLMLVVVLNFYGLLNKIDLLYALTFFITACVEFLIGALLYIYIKSLYITEDKFIRKHLFHFIPVIVFIVFLIIPAFIYLITDSYFKNYMDFVEENDFIFMINGIYLFLYGILSLRLLKKYEVLIKQNFSNLMEKDFKWIEYLLKGMLVVISIELTTSIYEEIYGDLSWNTGFLSVITMVGMILYLGYYGTSQSRILLPVFLLENNTEDNKSGNQNANTFKNKSKEELEELKLKIKQVFKDDKPYLDEDLTLNKLAQLIPTTDKKLSAFLNQYMDTNFYDFVNSYRIESVKEKLNSADFDNITLLGIAYESGFKSKTSFNRIFKKETGLSPSEYKKSL